MVRILGGGSNDDRQGQDSQQLGEDVEQLVESKLQEVLQQELAKIQLQTLRAVAQAEGSGKDGQHGDGAQPAGHGAGEGSGQAAAPAGEDPAAVLARMMGEVDWDISGELTENLTKLKQVIRETQAIAQKLEALVGANGSCSGGQPRGSS